jgi:hypothetical protein
MNYRPQLSPPAGPDALSRWVWARQQVRAWCSVHRAPIQIQKPAIEASRRALDAGHRPETLPIGGATPMIQCDCCAIHEATREVAERFHFCEPCASDEPNATLGEPLDPCAPDAAQTAECIQ